MRSVKKALYIVMVLVICLAVLAGIGAFSLLHSPAQNSTTPTPSTIVGHITFTSSQNAAHGVFDQARLNLQHIPSPDAGKTYYAWIEKPNSSEAQAAPHWQLHVNQGIVQDSYVGNAQHTNLLVPGNLFLITEEDANSTPLIPYPVPSKGIYYAVISQRATQTFEVKLCPKRSTGNPCI